MTLQGAVVIQSGPSDAEMVGYLDLHTEPSLDTNLPRMGCDLGQGNSLQP